MAEEPEHWYQEIAEFLGPAYLQNAFTKGTRQEIDFLMPRLGISAGDWVLDAGCGPGRHSLELARRGIKVHGVDISPAFVDLAREAAEADGLDCTFEVADLGQFDAAGAAGNIAGRGYDAAICLCQGGFGLHDEGDSGDRMILRNIVRAVKQGGKLALTAFSAFFALAGVWEGDHSFDVETELFHETAELRDSDGNTRPMSMTTACYTPRELRLLASICGLESVEILGVEPGAYAARPPSTDLAELLMLASRR